MPTLKVTWYATYNIIDWVLYMEFKTKIKFEKTNAAIKMKDEVIYCN